MEGRRAPGGWTCPWRRRNRATRREAPSRDAGHRRGCGDGDGGVRRQVDGFEWRVERGDEGQRGPIADGVGEDVAAEERGLAEDDGDAQHPRGGAQAAVQHLVPGHRRKRIVRRWPLRRRRRRPLPRGASPSSGRVLDDAGAGGGVDGVASEDGVATSDPLFSALGRRLRFPATTRPGGARVDADPAARDAPRKDASGVAAAGWRMRVRVIMPAARSLRVKFAGALSSGKREIRDPCRAPERAPSQRDLNTPAFSRGVGRRVADGGARGRRRGRASPVHGTGPGREVRSRGAFKDPRGAGDPLAIPRGTPKAGRFWEATGAIRSGATAGGNFRADGARGSHPEETRP